MALSLGIAKSGGGFNDNYLDNLKRNQQQVGVTVLFMIVVFYWMNYIITFIKNENLRHISKKIILQEEVSCVMDNLDEVIISKS